MGRGWINIDSYLYRFTKKGLLNLFLVIVFPIHAWSFLLVLRDAKWIMERSYRAADVFGYGSYAMVVGFAESMFVFLVILFLSFLTPKRWEGEQLIAQLGSLAFTTSFWFILIQLYNLWAETHFNKMIQFIVTQGHPVRIYYISATIIIVLVITSYVLPMYIINNSKKAEQVVTTIFERIVILSAIYLIIDAVGLINIILRNIR